MRAFLKGETVTLHRVRPRIVGGVRQYDAYGVIIMDEHNETVAGCAVYPRSQSEETQNVERSRTTWSCAMPNGIQVDAMDRITWRGLKYEIEGEPERFQSPLTGSVGPTVVTMLRVEG